MIAIAQSEGARGTLAASVSRALFRLVAIGSNRHQLRRRIGRERLDTGCVDRCCDVDFFCFDLRTKRMGTDRSVLDPLERNERAGLFPGCPR